MIVSEILSDIDTSQISRLKQEFDKRGGSVSLIEFLQLFRDTLLEDSARPNFRQLVGKLRTLFEEIDINGDMDMTWEEFTSYVVLNGGNRSRSEHSTQHYQETEMHHDIMLNKVEKLRFFPEVDKLLICDKSQVVRMYKPVSQKFSDDLVLVKELHGHTGAVLNAEYIGSSQCLATSSTDNTVALWDAAASFRLKSKLPVHSPMLSLLWHPSHDLLYTAGTDGTIFSYSMATMAEKSQLIGHTDMTMDLKLISNTPLMASASLDTRVFIWDLTTGEISTQVKGHTKGVVALSYSARHKLLFSGSFDRDILAWNPVVDGVVFKLKGHHTSLVGLECIDDSSYLISADHDGTFKLWDIRTSDCLQTFTSNTPVNGLCAFTVITGKRIVAGSRKVFVFDYHKPGIPWLTDDRAISAVLFNSKSFTIVTTAGRDVKIWDAGSGMLVQTLRNVTKEDITAACLDPRERKLVLGTSDGTMSILNYTNGTLLRNLTPHKAEVTAIIPGEKNTYISCSADAHIWVHDEMVSTKKPTIISSFTAPPTALEPAGVPRDVTMMVMCKEMNLLVTATSARTVRVWDMEDTSLEVQFKLHAAEVTNVLILHPYPVVASSDCLGIVLLYAVRPAVFKNHCICKLQNVLSTGKPCGVFSMAFVPDTCSLYTGDESGDVKVWSLARLFEQTMIFSGKKTRGSRSASQSEGSLSPSSTRSTSQVLTPTTAGSRLLQPPSTASTSGGSHLSVPASSGRSGSTMPPNAEETACLIDLRKQWSAHSEAVQRIDVISSPLALLTYSSDKRVRAWSADGTYFGTLRQSPEGGSWSLPVDFACREAASADQVSRIMQDLGESDRAAVAACSSEGREKLSLPAITTGGASGPPKT